MVPYLHNGRYLAAHHAGDVGLLADVLRARQPAHVVELGTLHGGLAALFAETVAPWSGTVHTFDSKRCFDETLLCEYQNLHFYHEDVLTENPRIIELVRQPNVILYTDNGNKERELSLYAPHLVVGNFLGTHDYGSEIRPEFVEPFLASLGYVPHRQEEFEALARPPDYPISMTRFWERVRLT